MGPCAAVRNFKIDEHQGTQIIEGSQEAKNDRDVYSVGVEERLLSTKVPERAWEEQKTMGSLEVRNSEGPSLKEFWLRDLGPKQAGGYHTKIKLLNKRH